MERKSLVSILAGILLAAGIILLGAYAITMIDGQVHSRGALRAFDSAQSQLSIAPAGVVAPGHRQSPENAAPMAVLRVEKLNLRVPVFEGTDAVVLNRGVGWIDGTAKPGEAGNVGIAGHRDKYFRGLKDLRKGDVIELSTVTGTMTYVVEQTKIVDPKDTYVLLPRSIASLTLVTCYPFYFVGNAPRRYILHATLKSSSRERELQSGSH